MSKTNKEDEDAYYAENNNQCVESSNRNNIRIDPSTMAQALLFSTLIALTTTVLQLRQDVAVVHDQLNNFILAKEFASFKAITEEHDLQFEKRLDQIERRRNRE